MIKLNNKNITYVALADTNNSLKAPKEIWYADSDNLVKLVYQRKDALIEGEDYDKYHWLKGRNGAYINTEHKLQALVDTFIVQGKYDGILRNPSGYEQAICGVVENVSYTENGIWDYIYISQSNYIKPVLFYTNGNNFYYNEPLKQQTNEFLVILKPDGENYYVENNGVGKTFSTHGVQDKQLGDVYLFTRNSMNIPSQASERYFHGDIAYFRITDPTFVTDKLHLIPCKLLKPVPKWLDANGIRRQVGECGMIDLVSGKFYGNVNSVGTFTVENYYERKEWLVGDGSAYIRTGHTNNENLDWEVKVANFTDYKCLFWQREGEVAGNLNTVLVKAVNYYQGLRVGNKSSEVRINSFTDTEIIVSTSDDVITINGQTYQVTKGTSTMYGNFALFYTAFNLDSTSQDVCCAYFRFLDSNRNYIQNLIPCTLTMDLPASMDANNIARTKGTSGMWDLVSDKFYGNVANSGTFKAVNLAEGVDYEVHQWLVGDDIAYIQGVTYDVWNNKIQLKTGKWDGEARSILVYDKEGKPLNINKNTDSTGTYLMFIFREDGSNYAHIGDIRPFSAVPDNLEVEFFIKNAEFYCKQNGVVIPNTQPQTAVQGSWTLITPKIYSAKMSYIREVLPDGSSYRSNLIPVKLLHSIPSKYDANGIARQSGECGMYDTVNDVFYGNVASSGTFSVSDDS